MFPSLRPTVLDMRTFPRVGFTLPLTFPKLFQQCLTEEVEGVSEEVVEVGLEEAVEGVLEVTEAGVAVSEVVEEEGEEEATTTTTKDPQQRSQVNGIPRVISKAGHYVHPCEGDLVCKADLGEKVPYFNAPIYLENKEQIGKVDEIFGGIKEYTKSSTLAQKSCSHYRDSSPNLLVQREGEVAEEGGAVVEEVEVAVEGSAVEEGGSAGDVEGVDSEEAVDSEEEAVAVGSVAEEGEDIDDTTVPLSRMLISVYYLLDIQNTQHFGYIKPK
ncbi:GAR1 [Branchiostoma lanceolatum]|uniref:H/ACA ribonucleoprotein complex subunit n=1 Tax=Branchiostoma lanceolatum TaxID=7740 RepID=A0A8J9Z2J3_BRALA|nr:GAR1 [Branchiostoma lanceolatum]